MSVSFLGALPRVEALARIAEAGFEHVELSAHEGHLGDWMSDPAAAQRDIESADLRAWSVHSPGTSFDLAASAEAAGAAAVASAASCFAPAAGVGAGVVVVHCNAPGKPFDPADYDESLMRTRGSLEALAAAAAEAGIRLALENMIPRPGKRPGCDMAEVLALIDGLGDHVGVCLDTGHNNPTGAKVADSALLAGVGLFTLHLQDNNGRVNEDEHLLPGEGTIDWDALLDALDELHFDSPRIFEVAHHGAEGAFNDTMARLAEIIARWRARGQ